MSSENIVKLDIGGTVFKTSKSTLTKFDGMFKTMLETSVPVKKGKSGSIFIDRDPFHFRSILNFMRDGDVELPDSVKELKEIRKEAQYYLLTDLVDLCNSKLPQNNEETLNGIRLCTAIDPANSNSSNPIPVIESRAEALRIIAKSKKPVLIITCPDFPEGTFSYPEGFDVNSFYEKYKKHFYIYFKTVESRDFPWISHSALSFKEEIGMSVDDYLKRCQDI